VLDIVAFCMIFVGTIRLFLIFPKHKEIFKEFSQSQRVGYLILLCPLAPMILWAGLWIIGFIPSFILAALCLIVVWYVAHAQYHFFDAQGTARVKPAQQWLSRVEMLSILGGVYLIIALLFVLVPFIVVS
jgi:hypothetical protein